MSSSSKGKDKCLGPRFYDYLNGLREEFDLQANATPRNSSMQSRFNYYLGGLELEFELMAQEIESLRKERDEYREKGIFVFTTLETIYVLNHASRGESE